MNSVSIRRLMLVVSLRLMMRNIHHCIKITGVMRRKTVLLVLLMENQESYNPQTLMQMCKRMVNAHQCFRWQSYQDLRNEIRACKK